MNLVKYTLCDIELVMVDIEGTLYCSTPQLEKVFGADSSNLTKLVRRYPEEFSKATCEMLTGYNVPSREVLGALELKRFRKNTRLWSEDDVIGFTWLVRGDIARQCRAQFKDILKQHARRNSLPLTQVEAMMSELKAQIAPLQAAVEELMSDRKEMASYAGKTLRLVRNKD